MIENDLNRDETSRGHDRRQDHIQDAPRSGTAHSDRDRRLRPRARRTPTQTRRQHPPAGDRGRHEDRHRDRDSRRSRSPHRRISPPYRSRSGSPRHPEKSTTTRDERSSHTPRGVSSRSHHRPEETVHPEPEIRPPPVEPQPGSSRQRDETRPVNPQTAPIAEPARPGQTHRNDNGPAYERRPPGGFADPENNLPWYLPPLDPGRVYIYFPEGQHYVDTVQDGTLHNWHKGFMLGPVAGRPPYTLPFLKPGYVPQMPARPHNLHRGDIWYPPPLPPPPGPALRPPYLPPPYFW